VAAAAVLATAAAVPAVQAQTSAVNVYGLIHMSVGSYKAPGGQRQSMAESGKMTTSFLGFGGSEDLGNGLSANFKLETFFRSDVGRSGRFDGDGDFTRTASVGLAHKRYGALNLGRNTTSLFVSTLMFNAVGDSFGFSPAIRQYFTSNTVTGDTGWNDSIAYSSPNLAGFRVNLAYAFKEGQAATDGNNWSVGLGYGQGPLAVSYVMQEVKKGAVNDTKTQQLGGSYDFGVAKVFAQYGEVENLTTGNEFDISGLGVRAPVGPGAVVAQWGRLDAKTGADRSSLTLGYLYNLSKRTEVYAMAMQEKEDGKTNGSSYAVGVRHRF
jgi:predicted porin